MTLGLLYVMNFKNVILIDYIEYTDILGNIFYNIKRKHSTHTQMMSLE